ncbi:MAG: DNA polymerase III subunit alpha [Planctomycetota bacterium]|nr:MAG: DNA polymerase III subunit alpha [Planctomycetota bacterium]REK26481.1 MAG: DNA polymerase III subunit alpha [Planctomycetota bacterium]REK38704.1 MAG: DNA polymerase III subunit alpha [Planctomycetota bacterium]
MSQASFTHLHCHSHYSLLDGAAPIKGLVNRAKELGMNSLALTDHGNLHGAVDFYQAAKAADINPILGYEAYVAHGSRFDRQTGSTRESSYHLTLLAQNRTGFKNLIRLASAAFLEGFYVKPRIDRELLERYNEGVLCLSGCVSSEFNRRILQGGGTSAELEPAREVASWFHQVFGDRYFIEIQNNGLSIQQTAMEGALEIARSMGLPTVATCDSHYVKQEDAEAQDILLCINTGKFRTDTNRMKMENDQFYLKSPEEMYEQFADHADAVRRSQEIADTVDIDLELGKRHFPTFPLPQEQSSEDYLRELCVQGLQERYAETPGRLVDGQLAADVQERLDRELEVINKLGFPNYFLIVWDFVRYAREQGIPATARGSGVGSLVCYALYLSHVCPLEYDLLFERFLDESRREAPDIDIDFCKDRRGDVIQYVKDKYGEANVAQIGTFGTLAARAAIRDVGRAMSLAIPRVDSIVAMVPDKLGITLREAIEASEELAAAYDGDAEVRELLDLAQKIEGLARNVGTHAAAVVIADQPLTEYVPLGRVPGKEDVITQWAMNEVEAAGLLKMDFLGLRNLTILSRAVELIEQTTGQVIDPHKFPLDDEPTYALLCRGETKGIFQLESGGIRDLLQKMKPDHFRDIIATAALYRPGPLEGGMVDDYVAIKHRRRKAVYPHPVTEDILAETHGVMVYQEQVMRILNRLGNIGLSDAYSCIKAISKKKLPQIAKYQQEFLAGATSQGLSDKEAADLFGMIEKFAGYGFNKSHSTAYALIAYQTAYLKAHYPLEFMAALLSGDIAGRNFKKKDALVEHLEDCKRMGIEVAPPDVNHSRVDFAVEKAAESAAGENGAESAATTAEQNGAKQLPHGRILFALSAIKGCGDAAAAEIVRAREADGPYRDIFDFCERVDSQQVGRSTIETLVKAGAFDSTGAKRSQVYEAIERGLQAGASRAADRRSGQTNFFDAFDEEEEAEPTAGMGLADMPEWEDREILAGEKEVLGYYLTSHPLDEHESELAQFCTHRTTELAKANTREEVLVGGVLSSLKYSNTRNPRAGSTNTRYVMFDLEDKHGVIRCIAWPEQFAAYEHLIAADAILLLRGTVDRRPGSDEANIIVNELIPLGEASRRYTRGLKFRIEEAHEGAERLQQLREIVRRYPGNAAMELTIVLADGRRVQCECDARIEVKEELVSRAKELLGEGNCRSLIAAPQVASRPSPPKYATQASS